MVSHAQILNGLISMYILTDFNHSSLYIRTPNLSKIVKFAFFKDFSDFRSIGAWPYMCNFKIFDH